MTILDEIAAYTRQRVEKQKKIISMHDMVNLVSSIKKDKIFPFRYSLCKNNISFILECKKASPSKGLIDPVFDYMSIALEYQKAQADCISVLTEPKWFLGNDLYLENIASTIPLPCLRKDFIIDEYMIYQSISLKASAVLLICSLLDIQKLADYIALCHELGLDALVEAHNEREIDMALKAGALIIGINNRNLKDFSIDTDNSARLRKLVPDNIIFVSESGIQSREDIVKLHALGVNAVLIGQSIMLAPDKKKKLSELKGYV